MTEAQTLIRKQRNRLIETGLMPDPDEENRDDSADGDIDISDSPAEA